MSFDEERDSPRARFSRAPRYKEEDLSPTTPRELLGWFSYAVAAEVFAVVGVGAFLPLTLEQLARERGVYWGDRLTPCTSPFPAGKDERASRMLFSRDSGLKDEQCVVKVFGGDITTASFAFYTSSAAVLVQAITLVCFSSFADHGPYRKKLLLTFAYTGSLACILFIFVTPTIFLAASLLTIIAITCLGSSFTLLNAFLPLIVSNHPSDTTSSLSDDVTLEPLNPDGNPSSRTHRMDPDKLTRDLQLSAKISSKGMGISYTASVLVELASIGILFLLSKTSIDKLNATFSKRFILMLCGLWWAIFTIPTVLFLRPRPGAPLPQQNTLYPTSKSRSFLFYIRFSLTSFWRTLKSAWKLKQVMLFLLAWFLLSDAIATISGTAILFARTTLHLSTIATALLSISSITSGIFGAFLLPILSARYSLPPKTIILISISLLLVIPLYGLLPYIPFIQRLGVLGLQQPWEIFPLGIIHGFAMGGISSYCRSFYSHLIPPGREAAFYALYAVTDKGSSTLGPMAVGLIVDWWGTIRPAFGFLVVLVAVPAPVLWWVGVERGRREAVRMAETDEGGSRGRDGSAYREVVGGDGDGDEWGDFEIGSGSEGEGEDDEDKKGSEEGRFSH